MVGQTHLEGVLDLLLQVLGDVIAVSNVPDARQWHAGSERLREAGQPAPAQSAQNSICHTVMVQDMAKMLPCVDGPAMSMPYRKSYQVYSQPGNDQRLSVYFATKAFVQSLHAAATSRDMAVRCTRGTDQVNIHVQTTQSRWL